MQLRSSGTTRQQVSVLLVFFGFTSSYLVPVFPAAKIPLPLLFCRPAVQDKTSGRLRCPDYSCVSCIVSGARALRRMLYRPDYE